MLPIVVSIDFAEASGEPSLRVTASPSSRALPASVTVLGTPLPVTNASLRRVVSAPSTSLMPCGSDAYSAYSGSRRASKSMSSVASSRSANGDVDDPFSANFAPSIMPSSRGVTRILASCGMLDRNGRPIPMPVSELLCCLTRSSIDTEPLSTSMLSTEKRGVGPSDGASARSIRSWMFQVPSPLRTSSTCGCTSLTASSTGARCHSDAIDMSTSSVANFRSVRAGSRSASAKSVSLACSVNGLKLSFPSVARRPSSELASASIFALATGGTTKNPSTATMQAAAASAMKALRSLRRHFDPVGADAVAMRRGPVRLRRTLPL